MLSAFLIILVGMVLMGILERIYPNAKLPKRKGWMVRAATFNALQLVVVMLGHYTWEHLIIGSESLYHLGRQFSPIVCGLIAYLINTWVFYWWHRIRHESLWVWKVFHQFHHSPERIEVITSFYKHPLEIAMNSVMISILVYPILGLTIEGNAWMSVFSALGEFFYHMNVKTPYWLGYFIQRPESHCLHHIRDKRFCYNYSDLPLWDILGGTFYNPTDEEFKKLKIGFSEDREELVVEMMLCKDVLKKKKAKNLHRRKLKRRRQVKSFLVGLLMVVGCLQTVGYIYNSPTIKGAGFMSTASPLPLVFSAFNGVETFSTTFEFRVEFQNGTCVEQMIDHKLYGNLEGPYNRRNVYGVIFSHGPFFDKPNLIEMRRQILHWGMCNPGQLAKEFGYNEPIKTAFIFIRSKTAGNENKMWQLAVNC